jgi:hypothetical protein
LKLFYNLLLLILLKMATTSYDGTCNNCGSNLSVWVEVRRNIDGIPKPEIWCIDCVRGSSSNPTNK